MQELALDDVHRETLQSVAAAHEGWTLEDGTVAAIRRDVGKNGVLLSLGAHIDQRLRSAAAVVVRNAPTHNDAALTCLFQTVAVPSSFGNGSGVVHSVTPKPDEQNDLSDSVAAFPLHTDSTFLRTPHQIIGLGCVEADPAGGESLLMAVAVIEWALTQRGGRRVFDALRDPVFPFYLRDPLYGSGIQLAPILQDSSRGTAIRYRADVFESLLSRYGDACETRHLDALACLSEILSDETLTSRFRLLPGDLLLIDNRRVVHGRTRIHGNARRRLQRMKGYDPEAPDFKVVA